MDTNGLTRYLFDYIEKKQTPGAIMLTAPWGTGKSHYIKETLSPELEKKSFNPLIISLYSISSIPDLCKGIFLGKILKKKSVKKKVASSLSLISRTIYNGITSYYNVDLNLRDEDYVDLFNTLDLGKDLLILEDVERTNIDMMELMGFINNLTEIDGVKVLLVTFEEELLKRLDEKTKDRYMTEKEKTVYDTLKMDYLNITDIADVLKKHANQELNELLTPLDNTAQDIYSLMNGMPNPNYNLRCVIYATEKMNTFLELKGSEPLDDDFLTTVFFTIVVFSLQEKYNNTFNRDSNDVSSKDLISARYPVHDYLYNYIVNSTIDQSTIQNANRIYIEGVANQEQNETFGKHYNTIVNYFISNMQEIEESVDYFAHLDKTVATMSTSNAVTLYSFLLSMEENGINVNNIEKCKKALSDADYDDQTPYDDIWFNGAQLTTKKTQNEFESFRRMLKIKSEDRNNPLKDFDYAHSNLTSIEQRVRENQFIHFRSFLSLFDLDRLIDMIKNCSSKEIYRWTGIFQEVYRMDNAISFFGKDLQSMIEFNSKLCDLKEYEGYDDIQKMQIKWFIKTSQRIIEILTPPEHQKSDIHSIKNDERTGLD